MARGAVGWLAVMAAALACAPESSEREGSLSVPKDAPDPVMDVTVSSRPRAVRVSWLAPKDNGSPILRYLLVDARAPLSPETFSADSVPIIEWLTEPGQERCFYVYAESALGRSAQAASPSCGVALPGLP
jgi:hypothetical protein